MHRLKCMMSLVMTGKENIRDTTCIFDSFSKCLNSKSSRFFLPRRHDGKGASLLLG